MDRQSEPPRRPTPAVPLPPVRHTASPAPGVGEDSQRLPRFWKTTPVSNLPGNDILLRRLMGENGVRLAEKWKTIATRYGSVPVEEDDVIDIMKGVIVVDRGRISASEARPFLQGPEFDADDYIEIDPFVERKMGPDVVKFGAHEDELGGWVEVPKTAQDFADIAEFERMEAEERRRREERGIDLRKEVEPATYSLTDMESLSIEDADGDDPLAATLDEDDGDDPLAAALDDEDDDEDSSVSILQNRDEQTPLSISQLMPTTYASLTATVQAAGSRPHSREPTASASRLSAPRQPSRSRSRASTGESSLGPRASSSSARHSLPLDSTPPPSTSRPPSTPHPVARMRSTSTARPPDLPRELSTSRSLPNLRPILRKPSDGTTPRRRATQNAAATAPRVRFHEDDSFHEDYMSVPITRHPLQQRKGKGRMAGERPNDHRSVPPIADDGYGDDWNGHAEGRSNVVPRSRSTEPWSTAAHDSSSDESSHSPTFTQQRSHHQNLGRPSSNSMPPLRRASVGAGRTDSPPRRRQSSTSQRLSTRRPSYLDSIQEDNFGNVMECTLCFEDGGRRAELAKFCRGRTPSNECPFEPSSPQRPSSPIQQASSSPFASPSASPSPRRRPLSPELILDRTPSYSPELHDVSPYPPPVTSTPRPRVPRPSSEAPFRPPRTASQTPVVPDDATRGSLRTQELEASTTQSLPYTNDRRRALFSEAKDHCESCIAAGGQRAEKEGYCLGRIHPQLCVGRQPAQPRPRAASEAQSHFTTRGQDPHEDDADDESEVQLPRPPRNEPMQNAARPQTPHPRSAATPTPSSATSNRSNSSGNSGSTLRSSTPGKGGGVAHCRACRQAGGVREQQSHQCRGRTRPHLCLFYRESDDERPARVRYTTPSAVHCRACRSAGGTREEQSHECRGKFRRHLCPFYQEGAEETPIPVRASTMDATRASVSPAATLVSTCMMVAPPDRSPSAVASEPPQVASGAEPGSLSTEQHASDDESEDLGGYVSEEHAEYTGDLPEDNGREDENATESTSDEDMDEVDDSFDSGRDRPRILSSGSESEASAYEESDSSEDETESAEEDTDDSDASWTGTARRRLRQRQQKSTARPVTLDGGEQYYVDLDDKAVANYAPPPDDPTLYHSHLAIDHSTGGFKVCDRCSKARGDRAERAMWCRGRDGRCRVGVQGAKSAQATRAATAPPPSSRNLRSHSRSQRFQRPSQADMLRASMPDIFSPEPEERTDQTAAGGPPNSQLSSGDDNDDADAGESMDVDDFEDPIDAVTSEAAHTTNDLSDSAVDENERQACANRKRVVYTPVRSPRPSPAVQMGGTASPPNVAQSLPRPPAPDNWAYRPPRPLTVHPTPPPPSYRPPRALSILPTPPRSSSVVTTSSPPPPLRALTAPVASRLTPPPSSTGSSTPKRTRLSAHKRNFGILRPAPHAPSSDPLEGLASDPPEAESMRSSSPIGSYSTDIVTRARDVGIALPPVPTGRLPPHLINAHQRSPPGQPLAAALSSRAFALPTPPPSSSSPLRRATSSAPRASVPGQGSSSRTARASMVLNAKERVSAQTRPSSNSSPGLMLPPPVPHRPAASPRKRPADTDESGEPRPPPTPSPRKVRARTAAEAELFSSPEEHESVLSTYAPPSPSPRKRRARTAFPSGSEDVGEKSSSSRSASSGSTTNTTRRRSDTVGHTPEHEGDIGPTGSTASRRRARSVATPRPDKSRSSTRTSLPATTASRTASEARPKRTSARKRHESVPVPVVHDSDEEWGLDEDAGEVGRIWREATAYTYV